MKPPVKLILEPTDQFFDTAAGFPVRLWQGTDEYGTPIYALIAGVQVPADGSEPFGISLIRIPPPEPYQEPHETSVMVTGKTPPPGALDLLTAGLDAFLAACGEKPEGEAIGCQIMENHVVITLGPKSLKPD